MMRIGTKLALGTGTLLVLGLVIGTVSYLQTSSLHHKLDELTSVREPVNSAANELKKRLFEAESATLGYFMTGDTTLRVALGRSRDEFAQDRDTLLGLLRRTSDGIAATTLLERLTGFYGLAEGQIGLREEQTGIMQELLGILDGIDDLLKNRVQPSVQAGDPIAYRRLQVTLEMQVQMNAMVKALGHYILTGDERFRTRIAEARQSFLHFLKVYQVVLLTSEEKAWAADLTRRSGRSLALAASVTTLQKKRHAQLAQFMAEYEELGSLIEDPFLRGTTLDLAAAQKELIAAGERANSTIMAILFAGMIFGVGAAVVTTRKITSPLRHLVSVMNAVDHEGDAPEVELRTSDEFRQVSDSFNTMMRRLVSAKEELRAEIAERRRVEKDLRDNLNAQKELQARLEVAEQERMERLRLFAHSVQRAQEEERARIARELHDDICQRLTGLTYHVEVLKEGVRPASRRVSKQLKGIREELDRSVTEIRRISSNLRPTALDDFGMVTALRILCREFQNAHGITTTYRVDPTISGRIDAESETAIYRIAQQALTNAARHAHATSVSLLLDIGGADVMLRVIDNGKGFARAETGEGISQKGFGLVSMRERAELLGGRLCLSSDPDRGTTVSVTIPLKEA